MAAPYPHPSPVDRLRLATQDVFPPMGLYLGPDDLLIVEVRGISAATNANLRGRFLRPDGEVVIFQFSNQADALRSNLQYRHSLGEGWLLGFSVAEEGSGLRRGATYVRIGIRRGVPATSFIVTQWLARGYLTLDEPLFWPGGLYDSNFAPPGNFRVLVGTNPAAGANILETVPANALWRLLAFSFVFTTDLTVVNRNVQLLIDDTVTPYINVSSPYTQVASQGIRYCFAPGLAQQTLVVANVQGHLPNPCYIPAGGRIRTSVQGLQAGDNLDAPEYMVEEWLGA